MAREINAGYHPEVARNRHGTPLVDALFESAARISENRTLCYVNADIILMSDFTQALRALGEVSSFLMVGRRWDLNLDGEIDFSAADWEYSLRALAREKAKLHPSTGIDYFVFNRDLWGNAIPPFAVGRTAWDNWFIYRARKSGAAVVDATADVFALHQNHQYKSGTVVHKDDGTWEGPEIPHNQALAGRYAVNYNIEDASLILAAGRLSRQKAAVRARRFMATRFPGAAKSAVEAARRVGIRRTRS
ncbi:MAG: hypothetical protein JW854_01700 [Actinobacteria bacterium]|nr:hypothetical protein [Actinomycetota bacterium]